MRSLIDGHNALHRLRLFQGSHEEARRALLVRVLARDPDAEVYFDARRADPGMPVRAREHGVRVRYCENREADQAILERVSDASQPGQLLVVTDDREVRGRARQLGAKAVSVADYFEGSAEEPGGGEGPRRIRLPRFEPRDFGLPRRVDLQKPRIEPDEE